VTLRFGSSYFRNDLSGLGADDQSLPLADQALLALIGAAPSLVYTEWAAQSPTLETSWVEASPLKDYQAYAVNDLQLVSVTNTTSSVVQELAVISPVLTGQQAVKAAFEGTPFAYDRTEAVYSQLDNASPPRIYFLYWLRLRDGADPKTGPTSLNYAATTIGGVLVYILEISPPASDRAHPASGSFPSAFNAQLRQGPITVPATPAVQSTIPVSPVSPGQPQIPGSNAPVPLAPAAMAPTASTNTKAILWVALGAVAAVGAYKLVTGRRSAA
jgi:hypothetical protein